MPKTNKYKKDAVKFFTVAKYVGLSFFYCSKNCNKTGYCGMYKGLSLLASW